MNCTPCSISTFNSGPWRGNRNLGLAVARRKPVLAKWKIKGNEKSIGRFAWADARIYGAVSGQGWWNRERRQAGDVAAMVRASNIVQDDRILLSRRRWDRSLPIEDGYVPLAIKLPRNLGFYCVHLDGDRIFILWKDSSWFLRSKDKLSWIWIGW